MMAKTKSSGVFFAALCVVLVPMLTSCGSIAMDPDFAENPTSIQRDGDSLLLVMCTSAKVTEIKVQARGSTEGWKVVFQATGEAELVAGGIVSTSGVVDGLKTKIQLDINFDEMNQFGVSISDQSLDHWVSDAGFRSPKSGIPQDKWLHWDGTVTEEPCAG